MLPLTLEKESKEFPKYILKKRNSRSSPGILYLTLASPAKHSRMFRGIRKI